MRVPFVFVCLLSMIGCGANQPIKTVGAPPNDYRDADFKLQSAGFTGCAPGSITISDIVSSGAAIPHSTLNEAWKVSCENKAFYCSRVQFYTSGSVSIQIGCKEMISASK